MLLKSLSEINGFLYSYVLVVVLIGCGLFFTVRTKFVQFRLLKDSVKFLFGSGGNKSKGRHISSFQAFSVALASRVGTGNLAGVALALTMGGPGAVFWMWITALLGAATGFIESTLAQYYKREDHGSFIGGPAYYIESGLGKRWMAVISAILITLTFAFGFVSVQSNTIGTAFESQFGLNHFLVGAVVSLLTALIIFGGRYRIAKVATVIVPFMAIGYLILALVVLGMNVTRVPEAISLIFRSAFGGSQIAGGVAGAAVMQGIRRGLFSNEAGLGSAPNADAAANVSHPVKQGLVQSVGVFIDTLVICTSTAMIILLSGVDITSGVTGIELTQQALESQFGPAGSVFVTAALFFFAFSTIIGCYFYGESNLRFFTKKKATLRLFRFAVIAVVMTGFCVSLTTAWECTDLLMAICGLFNIVALLILCPKAFSLLDDYSAQKKEGHDPHLPKWWK